MRQYDRTKDLLLEIGQRRSNTGQAEAIKGQITHCSIKVSDEYVMTVRGGQEGKEGGSCVEGREKGLERMGASIKKN